MRGTDQLAQMGHAVVIAPAAQVAQDHGGRRRVGERGGPDLEGRCSGHEELHRIDGAGHVRFLLQIMLPLCRAPLLTVGMFTYIGSWNALAWPLLVTNTPDWRPISVGLQQFVSEAGAEVHLQMAGAVIATLPVLLAYFLIQREFTEGISMSGLKG